MSRQIQLAILVAAAIVLSGGGFVAGMTVGGGSKTDNGAAGKADAAAAAAASGGRRTFVAGQGAGGANAQGQQVSGRVLSVGDGSITVEVRQPGSDQTRSVIALVGGSARVVRSTETEIKASDIKAGDQVIVVGQPDASTGVVSANAVVVGINALQQLFGGGADRQAPGGAAPSGSAAPRRATPSPTPTR